jgi:hypothetical protein
MKNIVGARNIKQTKKKVSKKKNGSEKRRAI